MKYFSRLLLCFLVFVSAPTSADTITLAADSWCPYNCEPHTAQEGYLIDIARAVFEKAGHNVKYKTTNWSRAMVDARAGKITGIVGALRDDAPGFIFPTQPQGNVEFHFYVLKNQTWRYHNIDSLLSIKLAVINNYAYDSDINAFIAKYTSAEYLEKPNHQKYIHVASGDNALENNIRMVMQAHVDALIEDQNVFVLTTNKMGVADRFVDAGSSGVKNPIYIAFSPTNPKSQEYAELLSKGMTTLRNSGELKKILAAYGLKDWELSKTKK